MAKPASPIVAAPKLVVTPPATGSLATQTAQVTQQAQQLAKLNEEAEKKLQEQARAIAISNQEAKLKREQLEKKKLLEKVKQEEEKLKKEQ